MPRTTLDNPAARNRAGGRSRGRGRRPGATASLIALLVFAAIWIVSALLWGVPAWIGLVYAAASVVAFLTYGLDKRAARSVGARRVPEATLLMLGLLGGWPGAIAAQQLFRHKTTKRSFRTPFWGTVVLNVVVFVVVAWAIAHPEIIGG